MNKYDRIWGASLLLLGVLSIVWGTLNLLDLTIPIPVRMVVSIVQIVLAIVVIVLSGRKLKRK